MLRKQVFWLFLLAAFILSGTEIFAQARKGADLVQPIQQQKPAGKDKLMIYSGDYLQAQLYGFVRFDMVYNTNNVTNESSPLMVANDYVFLSNAGALVSPTTPTIFPAAGGFIFPFKTPPSMRGGSFVMDLRHTRLGLSINGPKVLMADTSALVEFDFWGQTPNSTTGLRQGMIRMRHAYARFDWKTSGTFLQIGQHWSIVMPWPAQPKTVTFIPFGQCGNLFMREPMILLGQKVGNDTVNALFEAAMSVVQGGNDSGTGLYPGMRNSAGVYERGPGEASKKPGARARISFNVKQDIFSMTLGVAGHYQIEKHPMAYGNLTYWVTLLTGANPTLAALTAVNANRWAKETQSYSIAPFAKFQVSLLTLVAAYFRGTNMDTFLSDLGQGVVENYSGTKILGVPTQGGYAQIQFDLRKVAPIPVTLAAGYGGILKSNLNLLPYGSMLWNQTIMANIFWHMNDYIHLAFEFAEHQSKYKGVLGVSKDYRYHTQVQFSF